MQEKFDNFITKLAIKNFSITVIWVEIIVVFLILLFVAACVFFSVFSIDISIPVKIINSNKVLISKEYLKHYPKKDQLVIKGKDKSFILSTAKRELFKNSDLIIITKEKIPFSENGSFRLIIGRKNILEMLFKSKKNDNIRLN